MVNRKKKLIGSSFDNKYHQLIVLDALADEGENSLAELAKKLSTTGGVAIITEGLVNYFDEDTIRKMWKRFALTLSQFPHGLYLSDIHLKKQNEGCLVTLFFKMLSVFVRGNVYLHFQQNGDTEKALIECGFKTARLHNPDDWANELKVCGHKGANMVRVIEASA